MVQLSASPQGPTHRSAPTSGQMAFHILIEMPPRPPGQRVAAAQPLAALPPYGCGVPLAGKEERAEREAAQMRPCTPLPSASSATGRQLQKLQKRIACPKVRRNRRRHRSADSRTATLHARAKLRPKRFFSLDRARPISLLARPKEKWGVHLPSHQYGCFSWAIDHRPYRSRQRFPRKRRPGFRPAASYFLAGKISQLR